MLSHVLTTRPAEVAQLPNIEAGPECYVPQYLVSYAFSEAEAAGIPPQQEVKTIECESQFNQFAVGDHGKARSVAQFHEPTFDYFKKLAGPAYADLKYTDAKDQITLMAWAIKHGHGNDWSCYRRLSTQGW